MRWKFAEPKFGQTRTRSVFLWIPYVWLDEIIWLERVIFTEEYGYTRDPYEGFRWRVVDVKKHGGEQ